MLQALAGVLSLLPDVEVSLSAGTITYANSALSEWTVGAGIAIPTAIAVIAGFTAWVRVMERA